MRRIRLMGLNYNKLGDLIGSSRQQVGKMAKRPTLSKKWAVLCAPHLGCTPENLMIGGEARGESSAVIDAEATSIPQPTKENLELDLTIDLAAGGYTRDQIKDLLGKFRKYASIWPRDTSS